MKTHYWNAYYDYSEGKKQFDFFIEQSVMLHSEHEAAQYAVDYDFDYAYTLEVALDGVRRIDLSSAILDLKYGDGKPEYERLTGHEMGVCLGRV